MVKVSIRIAWPIKSNFMWKRQGGLERKKYINGPGHMTKISPCMANTFKTNLETRHSSSDPRLTLTYFTAWLNLVRFICILTRKTYTKNITKMTEMPNQTGQGLI